MNVFPLRRRRKGKTLFRVCREMKRARMGTGYQILLLKSTTAHDVLSTRSRKPIEPIEQLSASVPILAFFHQTAQPRDPLQRSPRRLPEVALVFSMTSARFLRCLSVPPHELPSFREVPRDMLAKVRRQSRFWIRLQVRLYHLE